MGEHQTRFEFAEVNGVRLHYAARGSGPLVVLVHGWPECWYSWRHQLAGLAEAGYLAVAPDMRGFGRSERPAEIEAYNILELTADVAALIDHLSGGPAHLACRGRSALAVRRLRKGRPRGS